ncbi:hypothetical protein OAF83_03695 [Rubripirellula sp.]|nr:hypothetical protein [Rubripirellula sp.]MDB4749988.1 hypothetical protein [Rubripirellula sp.]
MKIRHAATVFANTLNFVQKLQSVFEVKFLSEPKFDSALMHSPMRTQAMESRMCMFFFDRNRQLLLFIDNLDSLGEGSLRFILASGFRYRVQDTLPQACGKADNRTR